MNMWEMTFDHNNRLLTYTGDMVISQGVPTVTLADEAIGCVVADPVLATDVRIDLTLINICRVGYREKGG